MDFKEAEELLKRANTEKDLLEGMEFLLDSLDKRERGLEIAELCKKYRNKAVELDCFKGLDRVYIDLIAVRGYVHSDYAWRAKSYAANAVKLLDEYRQSVKGGELSLIANCYEELGDYYITVSRQADALKCYNEFFEYAEAVDVKSAALCKIIVCHNRLGDDYKLDLSEEEIKRYYVGYADRLINAVNKKGYIKTDPIENSESFQAAYDEVHEEARRLIDNEGDLHMPHQYWKVLAECFLRRGIEWKSPQRMNPKVKFD